MGGIGGLLARTDQTASTPSPAYYHADGNGNVTATKRRQWIERHRQSGLTQARFAQEHGLNHGTLVQWLCKARKESGERKSEVGGFIEMTLTTDRDYQGIPGLRRRHPL